MGVKLSFPGLRVPLLLVATAVAAYGQVTIGNEDAQIRIGFAGQFWGIWTQDSTAGQQGYQQNLYLRRIRLMVGGDIGKDVTFFFQTDAPRLGATPKALGSGLMIQDAFVEWKAGRALMLDAGLMLVPISRNALQSPMSYYTLDISPISTVPNWATQSNCLRDAGFAGKGYFFKDKLQYRAGVFAGQREANARNPLRTAGYLQYDFLEPENQYVFVGTALGKRRILAVSSGFDRQGSYHGLSAGVAADIPVLHGDEIGGQFQAVHYDGGTRFPTIPRQDGYLLETAYYVHKLKTQPFAKFEAQTFSKSQDAGKDLKRIGCGVNYYVHGHNLKWTFQYQRVLPQNPSLRNSNELAMQLQVFYF
jgi:hypothetical protein